MSILLLISCWSDKHPRIPTVCCDVVLVGQASNNPNLLPLISRWSDKQRPIIPTVCCDVVLVGQASNNPNLLLLISRWSDKQRPIIPTVCRDVVLVGQAASLKNQHSAVGVVLVGQASKKAPTKFTNPFLSSPLIFAVP